MNKFVRDYLIKFAKVKRPVPYSQIAKDCGLNLNLGLPSDRKKLSEILGEVSAFGHQNNRPLLSPVAMYQNLEDQGGGFYAVCEQLGFGSKKLLREQEFAIVQIIASFEFWSKPLEEFFTIEELEFFKT